MLRAVDGPSKSSVDKHYPIIDVYREYDLIMYIYVFKNIFQELCFGKKATPNRQHYQMLREHALNSSRCFYRAR